MLANSANRDQTAAQDQSDHSLQFTNIFCPNYLSQKGYQQYLLLLLLTEFFLNPEQDIFQLFLIPHFCPYGPLIP